MEEDNFRILKYGTIILVSIVAITVFYFVAIRPNLNVYMERKRGEAELARANANRKIKIKESEAEFESAKFLARAEVERAKGVANANKIIGESLNGNESYLRYLWIQGLQTNQMQTVYIPTEANLPILEANPNMRDLK